MAGIAARRGTAQLGSREQEGGTLTGVGRGRRWAQLGGALRDTALLIVARNRSY